MNKERIDDLVDILAAEYDRAENTIAVRVQEELFKYLDKPEEWATMQYASLNSFRKDVKRIASEVLRKIDAKTEKAIILSYRETAKDAIEVTEREIIVKKLPESVRADLADAKRWNAEKVALLANVAVNNKNSTVRFISQTSRVDELYDAVKRQMPKGIENGVRVTYSDGSSRSWRSYMEMNIRTTLSQEATELQIEAGRDAGIVFYCCDEFADCAHDHADYQGKIYYNAESEMSDEIRAFIEEEGLLSMQEVVNGEPYLTSRPNCRHNFHALTVEEVMSGKSASKIVEDNGYKFGDYEEKNYRALQQQRLNERMIRKYKLRSETASKINGETSTRIMSPQREAADRKVREWQKRQRDLIRENKGILERNYARENAKLMAEDVGVKYDYKVVDGELEKK